MTNDKCKCGSKGFVGGMTQLLENQAYIENDHNIQNSQPNQIQI